MSKFHISTLVCFVIITVACLFLLWPLFQNGFFVTDDGEWMIIRLSAFVQSLREGQFPVRFLGRLNHSFGYPVSNFLYPGYLYIGSTIRYIGFSYVDTIKILFASSIVSSGFLVYLWLRSHFNRLPSLIGCVSYILAPYLSFDLYTRGSVGEIVALVPIALGFLSITRGWRSLFPIVVGVLMVSHNSLALIFLAVFILMLVVEKKWNYFFPLLLGIGLSSFFWFPALYERKYIVFDSVIVANSHAYFLTGSRFFLIGIVSMFAFCVVVFQKKYRLSKFIFWYTFLFGVSVFMSTHLSRFLWTTSIATLFQFPYRFLVIGIFAGAWITAFYMQEYFGKKKIKKELAIVTLLFVIIMIIQVFPQLYSVKHVVRPEGFYTTNEGTTTVMDEYMPRWVVVKPQQRSENRVVLFQGLGTLEPVEISTQKIHIAVESEGESVIQVNSIYYPGWGALIDGLPAVIDYQNPQGVMRITVPNGKHRLFMEFRETVPRFIADIVSLFSLVFYCAFIVSEIKKYQKNSLRSFIFKK